MTQITDAEVEAAEDPLRDLLRAAARDGVLPTVNRLSQFARAALEAAAFARPVPQAGEVAEIVTRLRKLVRVYKHTGNAESQTCKDAKAAADLLTAQAAEIERWKASRMQAAVSGHVQLRLDEQAAALAAKDAEIATLKSDIKRETDRYATLVASDSDKLTAHETRIAELEAALRQVRTSATSGVGRRDITPTEKRIWAIVDAALAPARKEVKP